MRFFAPVAVAFGILFGPLVAVVRADLSPEEVRAAIQRGADYLKGTQKADGTWRPDYPGQTGGISCLCTLALLNAGVPKDDPDVANGLKQIEGFPDTFKMLFRNIYAAIAGGKGESLFANAEDGHQEVAVSEAIMKSNKSKSWVKV